MTITVQITVDSSTLPVLIKYINSMLATRLCKRRCQSGWASDVVVNISSSRKIARRRSGTVLIRSYFDSNDSFSTRRSGCWGVVLWCCSQHLFGVGDRLLKIFYNSSLLGHHVQQLNYNNQQVSSHREFLAALPRRTRWLVEDHH